MDLKHVIVPDWPVPGNVRALVTTRHFPVTHPSSVTSRFGFNLASHVHDDLQQVMSNRKLLSGFLPDGEEFWLEQTHSTRIVELPSKHDRVADGAWTRNAGQVCGVLTADCLPLLLCDESGRYVAAVHAGWRGLVDGILANAIAKIPVPAASLLVWMGPAIGQAAYEVGEDLRTHLLDKNGSYERAFAPGRDEHHWQLDLYQIARIQCECLGVRSIYGGNYCTFSQSAEFYSYRRQKDTGRMASLIWKIV